MDARGQVEQLWQYTGGAPTGDHLVTRYSYDDAGRLVGVSDAAQNPVEGGDPAGNTWTYEYDLLGRQTATTDPDRGTTTTVYDAAGQVLSATDARDETLVYVYDQLGRKTQLWDGSESPTQLARWEYDTLSRPGSRAGSDSTEGWGHASTEEVSRRAA